MGVLDVEYCIGFVFGVMLFFENFMEGKIMLIWNVIGYINGMNLDEILVIGNYWDIWMIGGMGDFNLGFVIFVELVRVFVKFIVMGWKLC